MNKLTKQIATTAIAGAMALIPAGAAFAQTTAVPVTSNNYYVGGGYGSGFGIGGYGYNGNLGQLFVLGSLFGGPYGNGVIGSGTSLGDLLMLNQIFNRGWYY
ncbi:MAG TPA: hypothetical protein VMU25_04125 [Candidatus Paceibacterota bacterium]|nr:hypothetical protein [Candidatus Paceibacterota bacterium]